MSGHCFQCGETGGCDCNDYPMTTPNKDREAFDEWWLVFYDEHKTTPSPFDAYQAACANKNAQIAEKDIALQKLARAYDELLNRDTKARESL